MTRVHAARDEDYVIDLCEVLLAEPALRQHTFDWLRGDSNTSRPGRRLPVDAFWPGHQLVLEYREIQHYQPVAHFDKPDRLTVSGVHRGQQRALYDARRDELIPAQGLTLVIIMPSHLGANPRGRLHRRNRQHDLDALRGVLPR